MRCSFWKQNLTAVVLQYMSSLKKKIFFYQKILWKLLVMGISSGEFFFKVKKKVRVKLPIATVLPVCILVREAMALNCLFFVLISVSERQNFYFIKVKIWIDIHRRWWLHLVLRVLNTSWIILKSFLFFIAIYDVNSNLLEYFSVLFVFSWCYCGVRHSCWQFSYIWCDY